MNRSEKRKKLEDRIVVKQIALSKFEKIIQEEPGNMIKSLDYKAVIVDVQSGYVDEKVILKTYGGHEHSIDVSGLSDMAIINEITAYISGGCRMDR